MRHKYHTHALVLSRAPLGEASARVTLLTQELGLLSARAQSVRKPAARFASALATFAESDMLLVRGAEGWRVAGAVLQNHWHRKLSPEARLRASRINRLLLRLAPGDIAGDALFLTMQGFFSALASHTEEAQDAAECLAALRILRALGLDEGAVPGATLSHYEHDALAEIASNRRAFVARINRGIEASGL